jgi:hypothetical protein
MVLAFPRPNAAWVEFGPISVIGAYCQQRLKFAKIGHSGLGNLTLRFSLEHQVALQIDQAQAVLARQGMTHWSFSLKNYAKMM